MAKQMAAVGGTYPTKREVSDEAIAKTRAEHTDRSGPETARTIRTAFLRTVGLLAVFTAIGLSLSSFRTVFYPAFVVPTAERESRPVPQPYILPLQYAVWVIYYTDETGVPVWMACRLFGKESTGDPMSGRWDPTAVSYMGAIGLAQIMPENLALFAIKYNDGRPIDPRDPDTAIRVGLRYLADLHAQTGSWVIALRSYNGGIGHWLNPGYWGGWMDESIDYARAILGDQKGRSV
jgi:hypothetical protein